MDFGELAHVIPASPDGPRGVPFDEVSLEDRAHHSNLILLCANCHTTIDKAPAAYPAELLYGWKQNRIEEIRVAGFGELLDALTCDDNIAEHIDSQVQYERRRLTYNKAVKWLKRKGYHAYQIGRYKLQPLTIVTSNDYEFTADKLYSLLD